MTEPAMAVPDDVVLEEEIPEVQLPLPSGKRKQRRSQEALLMEGAVTAMSTVAMPLSIDGLVQKGAKKKTRKVDDRHLVVQEGWRKLTMGKVAFLKPLRPLLLNDFAQFKDEYAGLQLRNLKPIDLVITFFTPELVQAIIDDIPVERQHNHRGRMIVCPTAQLIWQTLAVEARITSAPPSHYKIKRYKAIAECQAHFNSLAPNAEYKCLGWNALSMLLSNAYILPRHYPILSKSFQSIFQRLGASVAGDEKLWFCSGWSDFIRKVPSKPGGVGLWMYQLSITLPDGSAFCCYFRMHHNRNGPIPVAEVVEEWGDIIDNVGMTPDGVRVNKGCLLVFDSYYATKGVFKLLRERGIPFTCSATKERMGPLATACLHFTDSERATTKRDARPGDFKGLYNECTGETFMYYYDGDTGVGEKFNYGWGFRMSVDKTDLKEHTHVVPVYAYYKQLFNICDTFNKGLNGSRYPYRRGKKGCAGMEGSVCALGAHNDFCKAVLWKNVYNAYHAMKNTTCDPSYAKPPFTAFLSQLADEIYLYSTDASNFEVPASSPSPLTPPTSPNASPSPLPSPPPPVVEVRSSGRERILKVPQEAPGCS
jgi:hypothetical protein